MNAREYLQKLVELGGENELVTFVVAMAAPRARVPHRHYEYRMTPVRSAVDWLAGDSAGARFGEAYLVINKDHPPIDITGHWVKEYQAGRMSCAVLTTEADLRAMYAPGQAAEMIAYYKRTIK